MKNKSSFTRGLALFLVLSAIIGLFTFLVPSLLIGF